MTADVPRELADRLRASHGQLRTVDEIAAALLPTVQALIDAARVEGYKQCAALIPEMVADAEKRAAARALRNLAVSAPVVRYDTGGYPVRAVPVSELLSAAAALDPPGAAEGAGR